MSRDNPTSSEIYQSENQNNVNDIINKNDFMTTKHIGTDYSYKHKVVWKNAIGFLFLHVMAVWGFFILVTGGISYQTFLWTLFVFYISSEGITIGAHRYFAHRTFKATPPLEAFLILCQTIAGQNSVYTWCRDHRLHHRYSDTDADPHNSKRGFFFSHMGWLMCKKHPCVLELGKRIDMSDLASDWMVMFQKKYYIYLYLLVAIFIPVAVPYYFMGESLKNSLLVCYVLRYVLQLNGTWLVNSAAHLYGTRPYNRKLQPVESWFVSFITLGEGWHNYHHTFPWDYKAAELSMHFNSSASVIRLFEKLGLAYDLKSVSSEMVVRHILNSGDGTHHRLGNDEARKAVSAVGILHPLNPTYNVVYKSPNTVLEEKGLPLNHENDVIQVNGLNRNYPTA